MSETKGAYSIRLSDDAFALFSDMIGRRAILILPYGHFDGGPWVEAGQVIIQHWNPDLAKPGARPDSRFLSISVQELENYKNWREPSNMFEIESRELSDFGGHIFEPVDDADGAWTKAGVVVGAYGCLKRHVTEITLLEECHNFRDDKDEDIFIDFDRRIEITFSDETSIGFELGGHHHSRLYVSFDHARPDNGMSDAALSTRHTLSSCSGLSRAPTS